MRAVLEDNIMALVDQTSAHDPAAFVGTWRRFGAVGPVYEIVGFDHRLSDGDWMMRIRVLDTGEEVGYKLTHVMDDPKEA